MAERDLIQRLCRVGGTSLRRPGRGASGAAASGAAASGGLPVFQNVQYN